MSIEQSLERIAAALEHSNKLLADHHSGQSTTPASTFNPPQPTAPAPVKGKTAKRAAPAPEADKPMPAEDPFAMTEDAGGAEEAPEAEVTRDELFEKLKAHSVAFGPKTTIALMVKHGSDAVKPRVDSIPTANYQKCFAEASADLAKAKKG